MTLLLLLDAAGTTENGDGAPAGATENDDDLADGTAAAGSLYTFEKVSESDVNLRCVTPDNDLTPIILWLNNTSSNGSITKVFILFIKLINCVLCVNNLVLVSF
jgi:hypothetical protein